jgi:hypothetical protein
MIKVNKNVTVEPLLKNYKKKRQYINSSTGDSEVVLVSERNDEALV